MQVQLTRQSGMAPPLVLIRDGAATVFWRCALVTFPFLAPQFCPKPRYPLVRPSCKETDAGAEGGCREL
jgi:hypothetical protein